MSWVTKINRMIVHVLYWSKGNICSLQSLFFLEDYIIQVIPPHPPFKKTVSYRGTQAGLELPTTPTSVLWVLDTMMDFQMTANICKTLAPGNLLLNWSFFTPDSWTQMTFSSFPDRWELLRSWQWERMNSGLSSWESSSALLRKASRMWVWAVNSLLLLLSFPFGLGWTAPDSRPNNVSFPLVFL